MNSKYSYRCLVFFNLLMFALTSCTKSDANLNVIKKALTSEEFTTYFYMCERETKEVYVYNSESELSDLTFKLDNRCARTINFLKLNFEFNINPAGQRQHKGVVLYEFKESNGLTELVFVDLITNANLTLKYDGNQELKETKKGVF